jgi:hypothetical protein
MEYGFGFDKTEWTLPVFTWGFCCSRALARLARNSTTC